MKKLNPTSELMLYFVLDSLHLQFCKKVNLIEWISCIISMCDFTQTIKPDLCLKFFLVLHS